MVNSSIESWYQWRWRCLFEGFGPQDEPQLTSPYLNFIYSDIASPITTDGLFDRHKEQRMPQWSLVSPAVSRFAFGILSNDVIDDAQLQKTLILAGDLLADLHRASIKIELASQDTTAFWGILPEGPYIASMRTQFVLAYEPSLPRGSMLEFYVDACKKINRLLLSKGGRRVQGLAAARKILEALRSFDVFGLFSLESQVYLRFDRECALQREGLDVNEIQRLINGRIAARTARDWETADRIRLELDSLGVVLVDGEGVTDWWIPYSGSTS